MKFSVLECVALERDVPEDGLCKGDVGTVVETYEPDGLEVEFVTASGDTRAVLTLTTRDVRRVGAGDMLAARALRSDP
jgi:hypothetical protein